MFEKIMKDVVQKNCDMIFSISTNWATDQIERYRIYVNKLRSTIFFHPHDRKQRIKYILNKI